MIMVTVLYWSLVYPWAEPASFDSTDYAKHSVHLACLVVEFLTNNLVIEVSHYSPFLFYNVMYLAVLIGYTTTGDWYIYWIMKLDKAEDWVLLGSIIVFVVATFIILIGLDKLKFLLLRK